jgi:hypothetical protein
MKCRVSVLPFGIGCLIGTSFSQNWEFFAGTVFTLVVLAITKNIDWL